MLTPFLQSLAARRYPGDTLTKGLRKESAESHITFETFLPWFKLSPHQGIPKCKTLAWAGPI